MCGRYTLTHAGDLFAELEVDGECAELAPRYNIAPTQLAPVVHGEPAGKRRLAEMRWGLIPAWAKDEKIGNRLINARCETVAEKPSFRTALRQRRGAVLADGFYEWRQAPGGKQPYHIHLPEYRPFVIAGLWERWTRGPEPITSFAIITTEANDAVAKIHARMPVILPPDDYRLWLDAEESDPERILPLLRPWAGEELVTTPVSRLVNNPANDVADCIKSLPTLLTR